jgi:hypothetical protein
MQSPTITYVTSSVALDRHARAHSRLPCRSRSVACPPDVHMCLAPRRTARPLSHHDCVAGRRWPVPAPQPASAPWEGHCTLARRWSSDRFPVPCRQSPRNAAHPLGVISRRQPGQRAGMYEHAHRTNRVARPGLRNPRAGTCRRRSRVSLTRPLAQAREAIGFDRTCCSAWPRARPCLYAPRHRRAPTWSRGNTSRPIFTLAWPARTPSPAASCALVQHKAYVHAPRYDGAGVRLQGTGATRHGPFTAALPAVPACVRKRRLAPRRLAGQLRRRPCSVPPQCRLPGAVAPWGHSAKLARRGIAAITSHRASTLLAPTGPLAPNM